jgi:hypothetical protein
MSWYAHPAVVGAIGSLLLAAAVVFKIVREHGSYVAVRLEQIRLAEDFARSRQLDISQLPRGLQAGNIGRGHLSSIAIVLAACGTAVWFCMSVWLTVRSAGH